MKAIDYVKTALAMHDSIGDLQGAIERIAGAPKLKVCAVDPHLGIVVGGGAIDGTVIDLAAKEILVEGRAPDRIVVKHKKIESVKGALPYWPGLEVTFFHHRGKWWQVARHQCEEAKELPPGAPLHADSALAHKFIFNPYVGPGGRWRRAGVGGSSPYGVIVDGKRIETQEGRFFRRLFDSFEGATLPTTAEVVLHVWLGYNSRHVRLIAGADEIVERLNASFWEMVNIIMARRRTSIWRPQPIEADKLSQVLVSLQFLAGDINPFEPVSKSILFDLLRSPKYYHVYASNLVG